MHDWHKSYYPRLSGKLFAEGGQLGAFQNAPGIFDSVNGQDTQPVAVSSSIG